MKKIVMGIAAVAMAASMFAADVSAKVVLNGTIFSVNEAGATGLSYIKDDAAGHQPHMALSVSGDRAGAGLKVVGTAGKVINLWLKPLDCLKISLHENALELFGDKYHGYYATNVGKVEEGYQVEYAANGLSIAANVKAPYASTDNFFAKYGAADAQFGEVGAKVAYSADFGSVAALFAFTNNGYLDIITKDTYIGPYTVIKAAAGYSGSFGSVNAVLNAGFESVKKEDDKFAQTKIMIDPSVGGNIDDFGFAVEVPVTIKTTKVADTEVKAMSGTTVGANVSASYNIDGIGLKAYFEDADLTAEKFDAKIGVDVTGNIDGASWKVAPNYEIKSKKFAIGYEVSMGW